MFVERFFNKKSEELKVEDIQNFIAKKIEENVNLDYKGILILNDMEKIAKHVSGFANTEGGLLILGVSEEKQLAGKRKERIYPGAIEWTDHSYTKEQLERTINGNTDPPVPLKIVPVRKSEDDPKVIFLLDIPRSNELHMHKTHSFYKRLNFESKPMEREEIINFIKIRLSYERWAWFRFHLDEALVGFMGRVIVRLNPAFAETSKRNPKKIPREFKNFITLPDEKLIDIVKKVKIRDLRKLDREAMYFAADLDKINTYPHEDITPEEHMLFDDLRQRATHLSWDWQELVIDYVNFHKIHGDWASLSCIEFAKTVEDEKEFLGQISSYLGFLVSFSKDVLKLKSMLDEIQERYGEFESCKVIQSRYDWLKKVKQHESS